MEDNVLDYTIGVVGGMGTYATIHLFEQYAKIFPAIKEHERPRIIIDNRCTMPSRVKAYLYNEDKEKLIEQLTESVGIMKDAGCNKVLLACNTSHIFLPQIYQKKPEFKGLIEDIVKGCVADVYSDGIKAVHVLGSEGTLDSKIYQRTLLKRNIKCYSPEESDYHKIRECMEAVKQNLDLEQAKDTFLDLINRYDYCILGCTELPILYEKFKDQVKCKKVYDPIDVSLNNIKKEYEDTKRICIGDIEHMHEIQVTSA